MHADYIATHFAKKIKFIDVTGNTPLANFTARGVRIYIPRRSRIDFLNHESALYFSHSVTLMRYSMLSLSIR